MSGSGLVDDDRSNHPHDSSPVRITTTSHTTPHSPSLTQLQRHQAHEEFAANIEAEFQTAQQNSWEYGSLFDSLADGMYHSRYDWKILIQCGEILLGLKDRTSSGSISPAPNAIGGGGNQTLTKKQRKFLSVPQSSTDDDTQSIGEGESDEDEDEEPNETDGTTADYPNQEGSNQQSSVTSTDTIQPNELGAHQSRAFRYLQVAMIRFLTPRTTPTSNQAQGPDTSFSLSSTTPPSTTSSSTTLSPILTPKSGDVIGVWLLGLLCSSKNRSIALSLLKSLEILGRVSVLRITIQKCFLLLQHERHEEDGAAALEEEKSPGIRKPTTTNDSYSASSSLISPHLSSGHVTPSTLLPLPALTTKTIQRFKLQAQLLRTLQVIVGDGVMLPSITTLVGDEGDSSNRLKLPGPNIWYDFVDTPIFPRVSGGAAPSTAGYCWSCWINISSIAPSSTTNSGRSSPQQQLPPSPQQQITITSGSPGVNAHNIFRFFNDIGHGVQVFLRSNTLCVRVSPTSEVIPLKNFLLHEHRWYFLTIVHKPKVKTAIGPPIPPVTSNMANVTSFVGKTHTTPSASYRPTVGGMPSPAMANHPHSPPTQPPKMANIFLYIDGLLVSTNDVPYPNLEHSESMQVSLGGFTGKMGPFHFFHDILSPSSIYSLFTLGAGLYSAPAHHIVNTGLVTIFPASPAATALNVADHTATASSSTPSNSSSKDDHQHQSIHPTIPTIANHRIIARVLLSHSPAQTTHEFCLPYAWADDWNIDHFNAKPVSFDLIGAGVGCEQHTLRLPGVGVAQRRNNSQWFVDVGGMKLLIQSLSPMYAGPSNATVTDEDVAEMLTLIALATQANPHNANQLLEIGAATFKQLLLEQLKKRHKTAVMINGLKHFLLVVSAIDYTNEQVHFASFVSYLLLDLTYWRACSTHIQSLVIHLLKLLVLHNPRPFILHPMIGVSRIIDSIRVITHRFFAPETQLNSHANSSASAAPTPNVLSPVAADEPVVARRGSINNSSLQITVDAQPAWPPVISSLSRQSSLHAYSPSQSSATSPFSPGATDHTAHPALPNEFEPNEGELNLVRTLLGIATELAQQSASSQHYEAHVLQPFLHLLQLATVSASNFPPILLIQFLTTFLTIIPISSHRTLTYLHSQNTSHIFVRLLFVDSPQVRTLSLKCLQHLNFHLVRLSKLDRGKSDATNTNIYLQADIATAIGSCLSLHTPISASEHDALFQLLMGQLPETVEGNLTPVASGPSITSPPPSITRHKTHRGMSLETGLVFCHAAYLNVILELALTSSLPIQSKILLDLLTLLRSNPQNVLSLASLFWQKLLLPFLSHLAPKSQPAPKDEMDLLSLSGDDLKSAKADHETIDVLVYQLLNLLLVHSMTNEPKGWQVLDQVLWCLDEFHRQELANVVEKSILDQASEGSSHTTVTEQWIVQVAIFNRLFQALQKSVGYLSLPLVKTSGTVSSSGSVDGESATNSSFSLHSEGQIQTLRRNIPAVFELTEWLLFHCKDSFLAPVSSASRRTSSNSDRGLDGAVSPARKNSFPTESTPSAPPPEDNTSSSLLDANVPNVNPDMPPPMNPNYRPSANSVSTNASTVSSTHASRASLRGSDEPLTEAEIEVLAGLLTGVVKNYPLPERRQDVLRIMFRYLMAVLPHPLCAPLCPLICDCVLHLFTERITEVNDKNNRLIALSLHLLKQSMEIFLRREDHVAVEQCKVVMGTIFARYGPQVFQPADPMNPNTRGSVVYGSRPGSISSTSAPSIRGRSSKSSSVISEEPDGELDLMTGPSDEVDSQGVQESPLEQALFHLYNGEGRAIVESTQQVFEQHETRLGYVCEARAKQVAESVTNYLKKQQMQSSHREKTFSLQSMDVQKRVQRERPFLLGLYQMKKSKIVFKRLPKDMKHSMKIHKLLKHYHYQHANSRPRQLLPTLLPPDILSMIQSPGEAFPSFVHASDLNAVRLAYSTQLEFWKIDNTESPTRMRKLVKKNFRGSSHKAASQNAATGKTAILAPQALDLANSLKGIVKSTGDSTGVDADSILPEAPTPTHSTNPSHSNPLADDDEDGVDSGDDDDDEVGMDGDEDEGSGKKQSKYLLTRACVMITAERKYAGEMKIAQQHLVFAGTEIIKSDSPSSTSSSSTDTASPRPKQRKPKEKFLRWPLRHIRMVLPRLYLLRESALEIFLNNFKNHFFNFTPLDEETSGLVWNSETKKTPASALSSTNLSKTQQAEIKKLRSGKEQRNEVYKLLCSLNSEMQFELSPGRRLSKSQIMKKWQRGEISNFDYLQHLNTIAGRSYNDINQYPVFPWILTDYKSETIDLNDERIYRDLSKPIGALNEDRFEIYSERYQTFDDPEIPGFMYGSHYSSAGIALYYLLRMEPFTKLAISLQGNHFDLADRLFDSISGAWDLSLNNVGDVKELIPEFFYLPDFLRNLNGLDLGTKQDKQKLGDVVLPPWAKGSPEEFVRIHRAALESDYVSAHLHEWIDLIFGWKQKGKAAVDACNVFFYLTYAGAVDIDAIDNPALRKATEDQIAHFGQTPAQLLTSPHPPRFTPAERAKLAAGVIALPAKLAQTYSSQLIYYYQPARENAAAIRKHQAAKAKLQQNRTMAARGLTPPVGPIPDPIASPAALALNPDAPHGHTFDADRTSILSQVPVNICFATRDIVITISPDFGLQTHHLTPFLAQPQQLLPPPPNTQHEMEPTSDSTTVQRSVDAEANEPTSSTVGPDEESISASEPSASSSLNPLGESDPLAPLPDPSATAAISAAGNLLVSTLAATPNHLGSILRKQLVNMIPAQRIPPAVHSSHTIHPLCRHWFLDPATKPPENEKVTLKATHTSSGDHLKLPVSPVPTFTSTRASPPSSATASPLLGARSSTKSPASGPSDLSTIHPCVTAIAQNGQFLFSGGYFDGSVKCHSILHFKSDEPSAAPPPELFAPPKHSRSPTSPPVLTATTITTSNVTSTNRAVIQTRRIVDCKPLSTVQHHHAPVSAICLAHNQSILLTGDAHGTFCVWRVFTAQHERNRPPFSSSPLATFAVHEGKILSIASNTYVGVAVSLAMDLEGKRGCELCVYSVRGSTTRFIRSQLAPDPETDWRMVTLTSNANIVISGSQSGVPMLFAYSINGQLLRTVPTNEVINVLYSTPATAKTNAYEGFVVTGGRKSVVVFRSPNTLEPVQSFFCDDLYPQSIAHESSSLSGRPSRSGSIVAESSAAPSAAADLWDGSSSSSSTSGGTASSTTPTKPPSLVPSTSALVTAAHADPLVASLAADTTLNIRMGIASLDISPSQQHFVVAMYPDAFPPVPTEMDLAADGTGVAGSAEPHHLEGRLLLFPLPHSSHDLSQLGFYLDYGWNTLETVRDALNNRFTDTRDLARDKLSEAAGKATEKFQQAKSKIFSAFSGLFSKK